jgi:serine acetyltransferase
MTLAQMLTLIAWDLRINRGFSFDCIRAKLLLVEVRIEQYVYRKCRAQAMPMIVWYFFRLFGSIFQWMLCNSNIPGTITIGRGLRLPHPQNIILAGFADIGEFCTIYHNVSIAWNGFKRTVPLSPKIGGSVLIGAGAILVGDITIGSDVLIGAGTVVSRSVPDHSRVTSARAEISPRCPSAEAAEPGSEQHILDPYSIWR